MCASLLGTDDSASAGVLECTLVGSLPESPLSGIEFGSCFLSAFAMIISHASAAGGPPLQCPSICKRLYNLKCHEPTKKEGLSRVLLVP